MSDENRTFEVHRQSPAEEPTAAAYLRVVLSPEVVEPPRLTELFSVVELPRAVRADLPEPSASAHMVIKSVPVTAELKGSFPASDAPTIFDALSITAAGMTGIVCALVTAYLATEHAPANLMPWFVGLAAAQLGVAVAVIFRIGRRSHGGRSRPEAGVAAPQPMAPVSAVQPPRDPSGRTVG
jgi:hypothetical protein